MMWVIASTTLETHEDYSNSATITKKYALEQHFGLWFVKMEKRRDKDAKEDSSRMLLGVKNTMKFSGSSSRTSRVKHSTCPEHQTFDDIFPGFNALPDGLGTPSLPAAVSWKQQ
ncbi:unnamed protein product [Polarella glacialis]|uniref:Uncharacterized protein n=1 Tax=Polarella glacialis TaxID=89957 RepID=A0A813KVC4_POLGL|nr:unnamed protein product [Polarella glacialis]CAE8711357.1 unnamed protein product [Polarella glacialis]